MTMFQQDRDALGEFPAVEDVPLWFFERTCDREFEIRDVLPALGFDGVENDHDDFSMDRLFTFRTEQDCERFLKLVEPLESVLPEYCIEGGLSFCDEEPLTIRVPFAILWPLAQYLLNIERHQHLTSAGNDCQ